MAVLKAQRAKKSDRNDADNEDDAGRIAEASASEDTGIQQKQMLLESRKLLLGKPRELENELRGLVELATWCGRGDAHTAPERGHEPDDYRTIRRADHIG